LPQLLPTSILCLILFVATFQARSQDDAYWIGLPAKNPAAIGTATDWVYGGYLFSNHDNTLSSYQAGIDYELSPKVGSIGFLYTNNKAGYVTASQFQLSYSYTFSVNELGKLSIGVGAGTYNYKNDLRRYKLFQDGEEDPGYENPGVVEWKLLQTGLGLFFNSACFDLGLSYYRYDELKDESNTNSNYSLKEPPGVVTALGAYRFKLGGKFVVEPNLLLEFTDGNTDKYAGVFFKLKERVWAGYNSINFNDLHSVMTGVDLKGRYRVGYSYSFPKLFDGDYLNMHEFLLAVRIK
jgi:type IX secretion system PorP/SprF family membrane protein